LDNHLSAARYTKGMAITEAMITSLTKSLENKIMITAYRSAKHFLIPNFLRAQA
jgi:hypothetical protein